MMLNMEDFTGKPSMYSAKPLSVPQKTNNLDGLGQEELLAMRDRIDQILPPMTLQALNLEEELVRQYRKAQSLQETVLADDSVPANQRAQVLSACAATLQQLVKMQTDLHTAERFKTLEGLMIRYMKKLPLEVATAFLDEYEALK